MIIPWPPSGLMPNRANGKHWTSTRKLKDGYKETCYWIAIEERPKVFDQLVIEFYPPDNRKRDADNLLASIKSGIDGICLAWRVDDSIFRDIRLLMKEKFKDGKIEIYTKGNE